MASSKPGVKFGDYHTYDDWGLRLTGITIGVPAANTAYIEVPGMSGQYDATEATYGKVTYGMRELRFTFEARNVTYYQWALLISTISNLIQGEDIQIIHDFDPGYYYEGRCEISSEKNNEVLATLEIVCNCQPYKMDTETSAEPWLWDTFSFVDGVTTSTSDIEIDSEDDWQEVTIECDYYSDTLNIVSNAAMTVMFDGTEYEIESGSNYMYEIVLEEGTNTLYFQGTGTVTLVYRGGRL